MEMPMFEASEFRAVMGNYPTGVVVVTAMSADGRPIGMVVGSFTSISLDPLLVGYLPSKGSGSFAELRECPTWAINVLSADQEDVCRRFAARSQDKFAGLEWQPGPHGAPLLDGALAWIECTTESVTDAGDHHLVLGRPLHLQVGAPGLPLLFFQGAYGKFSAHPVDSGFTSDPWAVVRQLNGSRVLLDELAQQTGGEASVVVGARSDLWVAATSAGARSVREGARIPLVAPVASVLVDEARVAQVSSWLEPYQVSNEAERREATERLRRARERGWSLALEQQENAEALHEGWAAYSSEYRTPEQVRGYRSLYQSGAHLYDPADPELASPVRVRSLTVPIGPGAHDTVGLRLSGVVGQVARDRIEEWILALRATAQEIHEQTGIGA